MTTLTSRIVCCIQTPDDGIWHATGARPGGIPYGDYRYAAGQRGRPACWDLVSEARDDLDVRAASPLREVQCEKCAGLVIASRVERMIMER